MKRLLPARLERIHWLVLTSLPVAFASTLAWFGVYTFVNAYLVKELGQSDQAWTAATLWFSGGMIVWPFICMEVAARLGRRTTMTLALLLAGAVYAVMAFTRNIHVIHVLLALVSVMSSVGSVAWLPLVAEFGRDRPGRALAVIQFVGAFIGATVLITGGYLIEHLSYRTAFLIFSAVCVASALAFALLSHALREGDTRQVVTFRQVRKADLLRVLAGPFLILVLAGTVMEPFNFHTSNQLYPNLARNLFGLREHVISVIVALGRLPALLSLFVLAHIIDRVNVVRYYSIGLLGAAVWVATMGLAQHTGLVVTAYFGYYLFHGMVWGTNTAAMNAAVEPRLREAAFAMVGVLSTLAIFFSGLVHNRLLSAGVPLPRLFVICGTIAAVGGVTLLAYSGTAHARRRAPVPAHPLEEPATEAPYVAGRA